MLRVFLLPDRIIATITKGPEEELYIDVDV
jgi:hypothetical protein